MFLEAAMQLLNTLLTKTALNETDFGLIESLSTYIEMQTRAANKLLELQLAGEGLLDYDSQGHTST